VLCLVVDDTVIEEVLLCWIHKVVVNLPELPENEVDKNEQKQEMWEVWCSVL
jgi:hypothetical protein